MEPNRLFYFLINRELHTIWFHYAEALLTLCYQKIAKTLILLFL